MFKIWWYPQQMRAVKLTSTQQQSCLLQHSTLICKVHLLFSNQPSHFLPQPASSMSYSASLSSFDLEISHPSQDMTVLSPQHMTIPTNTACYSQCRHVHHNVYHDQKKPCGENRLGITGKLQPIPELHTNQTSRHQPLRELAWLNEQQPLTCYWVCFLSRTLRRTRVNGYQ